jgi:gliding motility-associated-like protein
MIKISALYIFLFFISYHSYAETITTIGNGDWTDPHVWSSGNVPGPYDSIYVYNKIDITADIVLDHNYLSITVHGRLCGEYNFTVANHSFMDNYGNVYLNAIYITGDTAINHLSGVVILTTVMIISGFDGYYHSDGYESIGKKFTCDAPLADFNTDKKVICQYDCVNYEDLSINKPSSWQWTFQGGTPGSSTLENPKNICYADTGTFMVKLVVANTIGSDTIIKQVYIHVLPGVEKRNYIVSSNTILCPEDTLHLEMNASGLKYEWNNGSSDSVYVISQAGIYWADLINRYDCIYRDSIVIKSQTIPVVDLGQDGFFCEGHATVLNAYFNEASYYWQDGSSDPQLTVTKAGKYWVHVSDYCGNASDTINLIEPVIFIPNLITPNGDGKNDSLVIETNIPDLSLEIYNRWGDKIFSDVQYKNEWTANNTNDGVYYYYVANKKVCGIERKGWIEILR